MADISILLWGIFILVLLFFITICGILLYSGLFHSIVIGTGKPPIGAVTVAYKYATGPYKYAGAMFNEVVSVAPELKSFGCYYDNPKEVPENKQRYIVGAILCDADSKPDPEVLKQFEKYDFRIMNFPAVTHVVLTTFPYTTMLSIFISIYRVYPRLGSYIKERSLCAYPFLEIYDAFTIHFMAPLAKQDEFFPPEAGLEYRPDAGLQDELEEESDDNSHQEIPKLRKSKRLEKKSSTAKKQVLTTHEDLQGTGKSATDDAGHESSSSQSSTFDPTLDPPMLIKHEATLSSSQSSVSSFEEIKAEEANVTEC